MLGSEDIGRVVGEVLASPAREQLATLCHRALSRQAASRTLFVGEKAAAQAASAAGVARDEGATALGNVLGILENGPDKPIEWALLSAFAADAYAPLFAAATGSERAALARKFVAHNDYWLLATDYRLQPFADRLLDDAVCASLYDAVAEAILDEDGSPSALDPQRQAVCAARVAMLRASTRPQARDALARVAEGPRLSGFLRRLTAAAEPSASASEASPALEVSGRATAAPRSWPRNLLRWLSGWALIWWLLRLVAGTLRLERRVQVTLRGDRLLVASRIRLLGRTLRSVESWHRVRDVDAASRTLRWSSLPLAIGVACFCVGVLGGGLLALDAVRVQQWDLLPIASVALFCGVALDLVLDYVASGRRGRVRLSLRFSTGRSVAMAGVPLGDADAFLTELSRRLD